MRTPSRRTPPASPIPHVTTEGCGLMLATIGLALAGLACTTPMQAALAVAAIVAVIVLSLVTMRRRDRRMAERAAERGGESICTFARSFDYRSIDTWILRATFEELRPWCTFRGGVVPPRATDGLADVFGIGDEDLEDLVEDVARRSWRSLDGRESNPVRSIETVADLVSFLMNQPRLARP